MLPRRRWLWLAGGLSVGLLSGRLWWWRKRAESGASATLVALVDTIVPADEHPGALAAGAYPVVLKQMHSNQVIERLYQQGLETLQRLLLARNVRALITLDQRQREAVLYELQNRSQDGAAFVNHITRVVMMHYYSSVQGYTSVGYVPPLQIVAARTGLSRHTCG